MPRPTGRTARLLAFAALLLFPSVARAELLASYTALLNISTTAPDAGPFSIVFELAFRPGGCDPSALNACAFRLSEGQVGTFEFSAATSANFAAIAARLTDDFNDFIEFHWRLFGASGLGAGGSGVGGLEEHVFGGLLTGRRVDAIRLVVLETAVTRTVNGGFSATAAARWEIWGEGTPVERPVGAPEPATIALLGVAAPLLAICRRQHRRPPSAAAP